MLTSVQTVIEAYKGRRKRAIQSEHRPHTQQLIEHPFYTHPQGSSPLDTASSIFCIPSSHVRHANDTLLSIRA